MLKIPLILAVCTSSCSAACQGPAIEPSGTTMQMGGGEPSLSRFIAWQPGERTFSGTLASGDLDVFFDPRGGYVVSDREQNEVRVYEEPQRLLWSAGGTGGGPKEFESLISAVRTSRRQVIAADFAGKLVYYDSAGEFQFTKPTNLQPLYSVTILDDDRLLLSGRHPGSSDTPLLHIWNLTTHSIEKSFFPPPPHRPEFDFAYTYTGWADAAVKGDTVAVIFPLVDTLYLFRKDGEPLRSMPIPLEHFRRLRDPQPRDDTPEAKREWRNSYTLLSSISWAHDGTLYLQYFIPEGELTVWGLARLQIADGRVRVLFDVPRAQQFLGASPRVADLFFIKDDQLESTSWSIGRARNR